MTSTRKALDLRYFDRLSCTNYFLYGFLHQKWWHLVRSVGCDFASGASDQQEKASVHRLFEEAMIISVIFGILAPRQPRSANKGDVKSNGYKYIFMEMSSINRMMYKGMIAILMHEDIISLAWLANWPSRAIPYLISRLDEHGAMVFCFSAALNQATEDLGYQDPLLHQPGLNPRQTGCPI